MTIHFIDESDAWFRVLVCTGNNPVPDVRREDHAWTRRFFDRAVGKIGREKCPSIAERYCSSIGSSVNHILVITHWIKNPLIPVRFVELKLKPLIVINCAQKLVSDVD